MSNNRQQHPRVILLVAFTSILATSLIMATTNNGDAFAGKKNGENKKYQKIQNQGNGDNVKNDNVKNENNGNGGGDTKYKSETGANGGNYQGGNGHDGDDA